MPDADPDRSKGMTEQPAETCADRIKEHGLPAVLVGDVLSTQGVAALVEELLGTTPLQVREGRAGWLVLLTTDETRAGMPKLFVATGDRTIRCLPAGVPTSRALAAPFEWVCDHAELLAKVVRPL